MRQTRLLLLFTLCLLSISAGWAQNNVAPMTTGKVFVKIGNTEATAPVKLTNYGKSEVNSIEYTLCYMSGKLDTGILLQLAEDLIQTSY